MTRRITGIHMNDWGCMLRGYRREVVDRMVESQEYSTFIPALATLFAKRMTEIPVGHAERHAGVSNYNLWRLLNLQFDLLTSFSEFPLRVLLYMGTVMAFLGVAFGALLVVMRIFYGAAWPGTASSPCSPSCSSSWGPSSSPSDHGAVHRAHLPRGPQAPRFTIRKLHEG